MDETGLYWEKLQPRTYISRKKLKIGAWLQRIQGPTYSASWREGIRNSKTKAISGVSLRNSQSNEGIPKSCLPVVWTPNRKAWVTQQIFSEWYSKHFCHMIYLWTAIGLTAGGSSKGKAVPLQAWSGPEGYRKLRFPDYMTTAQDGGKIVSLTHRPPLPPGNAPGTHFY